MVLPIIDYRGPGAIEPRFSKLAVVSVMLAVASCPYALFKLLGVNLYFPSHDLTKLDDWNPKQIFIAIAMTLALITSFVAVVRIRSSNARLTGLSLASVALTLSGLWWLSILSLFALFNGVKFGPGD